jgi:hypothetical protein
MTDKKTAADRHAAGSRAAGGTSGQKTPRIAPYRVARGRWQDPPRSKVMPPEVGNDDDDMFNDMPV